MKNVIGEDIRAHNLAEALGNAEALDLFSKEGFAAHHTNDEDEIAKLIASYDNVIADPVFKPLVTGNFVPLPTIACSGGIFKETVSAFDTEAIAERLI